MPSGIIVFLLGTLAVLTWPDVLERFVSLQWGIGNIRHLASLLSLFFGVLAVGYLINYRVVKGFYDRMFRNGRHSLFWLIGISFSATIALFLGEVALCLLDLPFTMKRIPSELRIAQFDSELGWAYIPNNSVIQKFGKERREVEMSFDEIGARVGKLDIQRDSTAPTLILVGGSYTMGHGVSYEETFGWQLETTRGFPLQVVNLGVQAYGTDQSLLSLKRYFHKFKTKAVVYTFMDRHILRNSNYDRRVLFPNTRFISTKPLFGLNDDETTFLKKKPVLLRDSKYCHFCAYMRIVWVQKGPLPTADLTKTLIREMKEFVESAGAVFLVVHWRQGELTYPESFLRTLDINLIDTADKAPPDWNKWKIRGDGHPDPRAHKHVSGLLFQHLVPLLKDERKSSDIARVIVQDSIIMT